MTNRLHLQPIVAVIRSITLLDFILAPQHSYYAIAFVLVFLLFLIEVAGQLAGFSLSQLLDSSADVDAGADAIDGSTGLLAWLGLKKIPSIIWLVCFLTVFSIVGYAISLLLTSAFGVQLSKNISAVAVLFIAVIATSKLSNIIAKYLPKEETSAVSKDSFSGLLAIITVGTAKKGQPAEAVVKDEFNQKHYVLVEPMEEDIFSQGDNVVLVLKEKRCWLATRFD